MLNIKLSVEAVNYSTKLKLTVFNDTVNVNKNICWNNNKRYNELLNVNIA